MKGILVDFLPDTLGNLQELSLTSGIPRSEMIRRGTETALALFGVPKIEITSLLLQSLASNRTVLSESSVNNQKIAKELSRSASLSAAVYAIYMVNSGVESAEMIRIYSQTIRRHLDIIEQEDTVLDETQIRTLMDDVVSFANVMQKLQNMDAAVKNPSYNHLHKKETVQLASS
jgi:hypothetical protein